MARTALLCVRLLPTLQLRAAATAAYQAYLRGEL